MATPNKVTPEMLAQIFDRWNNGSDQGEIAQALSLNRGTVARHLRNQLQIVTPVHWRGGRAALQRVPMKKEISTKSVTYPDNPPMLSRALEFSPGEAARFCTKVAASNENGCRLWLASLKPTGEGQFGTIDSASESAYRVSWRLTYGPIPEGKQINHRCDVRACVEPTHLWLGTQAENLADMAAKGRSRKGRGDGQKGESNVTAKLTWAKVREIRALREQQGLPLYEIAKCFEISKSQASNITRYLQWVE